jgi:hypothetical protein
MDVKEIGWEEIDWICLAQDRGTAGSCIYGNKPTGSTNVGEFFD